MSTNYPTPRFRVLPAADPYTGRVGKLVRILTDEDGLVYLVQFRREPADYPPIRNPTAYYRRDELSVQ
jgi:hypothetical protein